jgi:hypothetical protein
VHSLFLEAALEVSEEPNGDQFLVSECWFSVIAQALITGGGRSIVHMADKQVDVNQ